MTCMKTVPTVSFKKDVLLVFLLGCVDLLLSKFSLRGEAYP